MKTKVSSSAVFGIILIAVGVIWFLNTLGYIDAYDVTRLFWPGILILFGVKAMIDYRSNTLFGVILALIGVMFIVDNLGYAFLGKVEMHEMIIPMIVILIGLNFVLPKSKNDIREESDGVVGVNSYNVDSSTDKVEVVPPVQPKPTQARPVQPASVTPPVPPVPPAPPVPPTSTPEAAAAKESTVEETTVDDIVMPTVPDTPTFDDVEAANVDEVIEVEVLRGDEEIDGN